MQHQTLRDMCLWITLHCTNMAAGRLGQGHSYLWHEHVTKFKNSKKGATQLTAKIQQMGTRLVRSHTAQGWQQTGWVWVGTVAALFFFLLEEEEAENERPKSWRLRLLWPEMFKAKAHSLETRSSSCEGFPAQWEERERVGGFSLQTELTLIYINHSSFFKTSTWARHGRCNTTTDIHSTQTQNILLYHQKSKNWLWNFTVMSKNRSHGQQEKKEGEAVSKGTSSHHPNIPYLRPFSF